MIRIITIIAAALLSGCAAMASSPVEKEQSVRIVGKIIVTPRMIEECEKLNQLSGGDIESVSQSMLDMALKHGSCSLRQQMAADIIHASNDSGAAIAIYQREEPATTQSEHNYAETREAPIQ